MLDPAPLGTVAASSSAHVCSDTGGLQAAAELVGEWWSWGPWGICSLVSPVRPLGGESSSVGGESRAMAGEGGVERVADFLCSFRHMAYPL